MRHSRPDTPALLAHSGGIGSTQPSTAPSIPSRKPPAMPGSCTATLVWNTGGGYTSLRPTMPGDYSILYRIKIVRPHMRQLWRRLHLDARVDVGGRILMAARSWAI